MNNMIFVLLSAALILCPCTALWAETTAFIPDLDNDAVHRILASDETDSSPEKRTDGCMQPYGAAVTPGADYLVVTCQEDGDFKSVIWNVEDFASQSKEPETVTIENYKPYGVAVDSRGNRAYVTFFDDDKVYEFNIPSGGSTSTFNVGDKPFGVVAYYDEKENARIAYVTNYGDDTISIIKNGKVTDDKPKVGRDPRGIALSPDGKRLYVANEGDDSVSVLNTDTLETEATINNVSDKPYGVAVASDGAYIFVTTTENGQVYIITTADNKISRTVNVSGEPKGIAAPVNGDFAYVVNGNTNEILKVTIDGDNTPLVPNLISNAAVALGAFIGDTEPDRPTKLEAETDENDARRIVLTWDDESDDETGFKIERREEDVEEDSDSDNDNDNENNTDDDDTNKTATDDEENYTQIAKVGSNETTFTDTDISSEKITYHYRIRAYKEASDSDYSGTATVTTNGEKLSWCFIDSLLN